jgi:hypothetical protein
VGSEDGIKNGEREPLRSNNKKQDHQIKVTELETSQSL